MMLNTLRAPSRQIPSPIALLSTVLYWLGTSAQASTGATGATCSELLRMTKEIPAVKISEQCVGSCRVHTLIGMLESRLRSEHQTEIPLSGATLTLRVLAERLATLTLDSTFKKIYRKAENEVRLSQLFSGAPASQSSTFVTQQLNEFLARHWADAGRSPVQATDDDSILNIIQEEGITLALDPDTEVKIEKKTLDRAFYLEMLSDGRLPREIAKAHRKQSQIARATSALISQVELGARPDQVTWLGAAAIKNYLDSGNTFRLKSASLMFGISNEILNQVIQLREAQIALQKNLTRLFYKYLTKTPPVPSKKIIATRTKKLLKGPEIKNLKWTSIPYPYDPTLMIKLKNLLGDQTSLGARSRTPNDSATDDLQFEEETLKEFLSSDTIDAVPSDQIFKTDLLQWTLDEMFSKDPQKEKIQAFRNKVDTFVRKEIDSGHSVSLNLLWYKNLVSPQSILDIPDSLLQLDERSLQERLRSASEPVGHAVQITGYQLGADGQVTLWKIQNSWGEKKGDSGYFYVTPRYLIYFGIQVGFLIE